MVELHLVYDKDKKQLWNWEWDQVVKEESSIGLFNNELQERQWIDYIPSH